ncbi:MAG: hypothetical protein Q9M30_09680 [Mariprofundaceae bacterium]|nr:hypothetical protein [Mariprofundaceae bacterium]
MSDEKIRRSAPALVEQTLAEHGAWDMVSFLLTCHRLRQADYEAWRMGAVECLEDVITGNRQRIMEMLQSALAHANSMGLVDTLITWHGWGRLAGQTLRLFHDDETNRQFHLLLSPRQDRAQLDLFMDAPHTLLLNRLRRAMQERSPELGKLFDRALDEIPNEPALARLDVIRAAMNRHPMGEPMPWFRYLEEVIAPAAADEFPGSDLDIIAPLWRDVAGAMAQLPFDAQQATIHSSEAWLRAHAWEDCLSSIEQVPHWHVYPCLHERRIAALSCMGDHDSVRRAWMLYCWLCPGAAATALDDADLKSCGLQRLWQQFSQLETAQPADDFPALIALHLRHEEEPDDAFAYACHTPGWHHYRMLCDLLASEKNGMADVKLRRSLKVASPWLFYAFMAMAQRR